MDLILKTLQAVGLAAWDEISKDPSLPENQIFCAMARRAVTREELQRLPNDGIGSAAGRCVRLPSKHVDNAIWMPLLWIHQHPKADHQMQLVVAGGKGKPFGYRWDPPESGASGTGDHDYWHVQPITTVLVPNATDVPLDVPSGDVCTAMPTFPIDATDQLEMLDAMFVSVYGPHYLDRYVGEALLRSNVQQATSGMHLARLRPAVAKSLNPLVSRRKRAKRKR